jgi:hypothetical protein
MVSRKILLELAMRLLMPISVVVTFATFVGMRLHFCQQIEAPDGSLRQTTVDLQLESYLIGNHIEWQCRREKHDQLKHGEVRRKQAAYVPAAGSRSLSNDGSEASPV